MYHCVNHQRMSQPLSSGAFDTTSRLLIQKALLIQSPAEGLGVSPNSLLLSPKIEDPPQEEWGIKGVERRFIRQPPSGRHICWIPCQAWNDILCGHYDDTIPAWFAAQVLPCHNLRQGCRRVVSHTATDLRRSQLSEENTSA